MPIGWRGVGYSGIMRCGGGCRRRSPTPARRLPVPDASITVNLLESKKTMISKAVIAKAANYREAFQAAQPFKHVCIDEFFEKKVAEASLREFPPFDREFARNEFGEYG